MTKSALLAATAGMEMCWILMAILLLKTVPEASTLSLFGLLSFYFTAFGISRLLRTVGCSQLKRHILNWSAWALLFGSLFLLPLFRIAGPGATKNLSPLLRAFTPWPLKPTPELLGLLCSAGLWYLGLRLARLRIDFAAVASAFQFGLAILLGLVFLGEQWEAIPREFIYLPPAFFFFALSGMSIAHIHPGGGAFGAETIHWGLLRYLMIGLILGIGLLFGSLVKPDLLNQIFLILKNCWHATLGLLWKFILFLLSLLPEPDPMEMSPFETPAPVPAGTPAWGRILRIPDSLRSAFRLLYLGAWLLLMLAALWNISSKIINWFRHRISGDQGAEITTQRGAFKEDLIRLIKSLYKKIAGMKQWLGRFFHKNDEKKAVPPEVASVRQVYAQLLKWAALKGCPRDSAQTPGEFLGALTSRMPEIRWELAFITHQYVHARYGPTLPTEKVLYKLKQNLRQIKRVSADEMAGKIPKHKENDRDG